MRGNVYNNIRVAYYISINCHSILSKFTEIKWLLKQLLCDSNGKGKNKINNSNGNKSPLLWVKDNGLCELKITPMESEFKISGRTYLVSDNDVNQKINK